MKFHGRSYHLATRDFEDVPSFQHVVCDDQSKNFFLSVANGLARSMCNATGA
jgi:hypothetical protein